MLRGKSWGEVKVFVGVKNSKMGFFVCAYINVGLRTNADWWGGVGLVRVGAE